MPWDLRKRIEKVVRRAFQTSPLLLMGVTFTYAMVLVAVAGALGLGDVVARAPGGALKQVGYHSALNWTLGMAVFGPALVLLAFKARESFAHAHDRLVARGMLVDAKSGRAPSAGKLDASRGRVSVPSVRWAMVAFVIGTLASCGEWAATSAWPLLVRGTAEGIAEPDWSVGVCLGEDGAPTPAPLAARLANAAFSAAAFLLQAWIVGVMAWLIGFLFIVTAEIERLARGRSSLRLRTVMNGDARRGFETFEEPLATAFLAFAATFGLLATSRIWNAYLHDAPSGSVRDFSLRGLTDGFAALRADSEGWSSLADVLLDVHWPSDFSTIMVTLGALAVLTTAFIVTALTIGSAARLADEARRATSRGGDADATPLVTWPLGWPPFTAVLLALATCALAMVFEQLMPVMLGGLLALCVLLMLDKARRAVGLHGPSGLTPGAGS